MTLSTQQKGKGRLFLKNQQNALDFLVLLPHRRRLLVHPDHILPLNQDQMKTDRKTKKMMYRKSTLIRSFKRCEEACLKGLSAFSFSFSLSFPFGLVLISLKGSGPGYRTRNGAILVTFRTCPSTSTGAHKIWQAADQVVSIIAGLMLSSAEPILNGSTFPLPPKRICLDCTRNTKRCVCNQLGPKRFTKDLGIPLIPGERRRRRGIKGLPNYSNEHTVRWTEW